MSVENIEKQFHDYLNLPNFIKFFRFAVELFFPFNVDISEVDLEQKKKEIATGLDKLCLSIDQLHNLQMFVEKFADPAVREMHFYPIGSQFSQKVILFLSAVQDFLQNKSIKIDEKAKEQFEKKFYSNTFVYIAEVIKEEIDEFVQKTKLTNFDKQNDEKIKEGVSKTKEDTYRHGGFYYINIYNIFYTIRNLDTTQSVLPLTLGSKVPLYRKVLKEFLSQKLQDALSMSSKSYPELKKILTICHGETTTNENNPTKKVRRFSISRSKAEDERNNWHLSFADHVKNGPQVANLKYFFLEGKFLETLKQYSTEDKKFLQDLNNLSFEEFEDKPNKIRDRSSSISSSNIMDGLKRAADTKNRKRTHTFIHWLVTNFASMGKMDIPDEKFAEFLLVLASLVYALRKTPVKPGRGAGNELARYLVTSIWNAFEISSEQSISGNNSGENNKVLTINLRYLQHLLTLQAFILSLKVFDNPIVKAVGKFVPESVSREPDPLSHKKKIRFAYKFVAKLFSAKTEKNFLEIFEIINIGIKLSRSKGKDDDSTGLEDRLIKLRDTLISAIVEKKLHPEGKAFSLDNLMGIYNKITGGESVRKEDELIEISEQTIPLLQFIIEEYPDVLDKHFANLYTMFLNLLDRTPEAKNGQKFDKENYLKIRLDYAVRFVDSQLRKYEQEYNSFDKTPSVITDFRNKLRPIVLAHSSKCSSENRVDLGPLITRPQPTVIVKPSSPSSESSRQNRDESTAHPEPIVVEPPSYSKDGQDLDELTTLLKKIAAERDSKLQVAQQPPIAQETLQPPLDPETLFLTQSSRLSPISPLLARDPQATNSNNNSTQPTTSNIAEIANNSVQPTKTTTEKVKQPIRIGGARSDAPKAPNFKFDADENPPPTNCNNPGPAQQ